MVACLLPVIVIIHGPILDALELGACQGSCRLIHAAIG